MTPTTTTVTPTPLSETVLRAVYASDQDMYPVTLSFSRVQSWVAACPELSISFVLEDNSPRERSRNGDSSVKGLEGLSGLEGMAGVVIVLPLKKKYWEDVLRGRVKEMDIDAGSMFPSGRDKYHDLRGGDYGLNIREGNDGSGVEEVGLHVYHVERFHTSASAGGDEKGSRHWGAHKKPFTEFALDEVLYRVESKTSWKVVGVSALTATAAGKKTFEKLGFKPTGYREVFIERSPRGSHVNGDEGKPRVEMICLYPGDELPKDNFEKGEDGDARVSVSEMTVKY